MYFQSEKREPDERGNDKLDGGYAWAIKRWDKKKEWG